MLLAWKDSTRLSKVLVTADATSLVVSTRILNNDYVLFSLALSIANTVIEEYMCFSVAPELGYRSETFGQLSFPLAQVISAVQSGAKTITHRSSVVVQLKLIAPDICVSHVLSIDPKDLVLGELLGQGGFGKVHRGEYKGNVVAVKQLMRSGRSDDESIVAHQEFVSEVTTMSELVHPNLVGLVGISLVPELMIVLEFVPLGDLFSLIQGKDPQLRKLAEDIAQLEVAIELFDTVVRSLECA